MRHPSEMGGHEISQFLSHLVLDKNVAINTQKQTLSALVFPYKQETLRLRIKDIDFGRGEILVREGNYTQDRN
jgi:hypothetical protein